MDLARTVVLKLTARGQLCGTGIGALAQGCTWMSFLPAIKLISGCPRYLVIMAEGKEQQTHSK